MRFAPFSLPAVLLAVALCAGCALGPDYVAPEPDAPAAWSAPAVDGVAAPTPGDDATLAAWWRTLDDPQLTDLVHRAVAGNPGLAQAQARLRAARAQAGMAEAGLWPSLTAGAAAGRSGDSDAASGPRNTFSAGLDARWELDLFGATRRASEAAVASAEAEREALRDTLVSLTAEVALNYVDLRALQTRLASARENVARQEATLSLATRRRELGLATELEVQRARASLEQGRAQVPTLEAGTARAGHRIAVLLGLAPAELAAELGAPAPIPHASVAVAVGVPADAVRRRPDVRRAERLLAAQTARIGAAKAAGLPGLGLTGSIGLEALTPAGLVNDAARTFSLGANAPFTLFDAGRIKNDVRAQEALTDAALAAYRVAVLTALEEVENALVALSADGARRDALAKAADAARRAATLAADGYRAGLSDFESVLDAERTALSAADQFAAAEGTVSADLIRLYKALGGGWTPESAGTLSDAKP